MAPRTKSEAAPVRAAEQERVGVVVELWVAIGRGQQHQDHVPGIQPCAVDFAGGGDEAAGALYRRVKALHFGQQIFDMG
ncbi:hypothetical protein D9M71_59220 [compost metagenome]